MQLDSKLLKTASAKFIYIVDNGYNKCIPAVPTAVAELEKSTDTLKENLKESIGLLNEILNMVPDSSLKNAFKACLTNINAANALVKKTVAATGEADLADIVKPLPGIVPTGQHSHLCVCHPLLSEIQKKFGGILPTATPTDIPGDDVQELPVPITQPQGVKRKSTDEPDTPTKKVYVPLKPAECHCGLYFQTVGELTQHVNVQHGKNMWKCSAAGCPKFYSTASSVRTHYRKTHSKQFRHYCDKCDFGHDEFSFLRKHMYKYHGIASDLQCPKCHHVFSQKNKLKHHLTICGHKSKTIMCPDPECPKGFRSKKFKESHGS